METFHRRCGEILTKSLQLEMTLDMFLSYYFCAKDTKKMFVFTDELLSNPEYGLNFFQKQKFLSAICKREKIDISHLMKDMQTVIEIRNKVAHHQRFWSEKGAILYPRKTDFDMKKGLELSDVTMKTFDEKIVSATNGINGLYDKFHNSKRIEQPNW